VLDDVIFIKVSVAVGLPILWKILKAIGCATPNGVSTVHFNRTNLSPWIVDVITGEFATGRGVTVAMASGEIP
jgi:hypothetical protein